MGTEGGQRTLAEEITDEYDHSCQLAIQMNLTLIFVRFMYQKKACDFNVK
jgi:hypothetical protein